MVFQPETVAPVASGWLADRSGCLFHHLSSGCGGSEREPEAAALSLDGTGPAGFLKFSPREHCIPWGHRRSVCVYHFCAAVAPFNPRPELPTYRLGDSVFGPLSPGCFESSAEAQAEPRGMNQDRGGLAIETLQSFRLSSPFHTASPPPPSL